MFWCLSDYNFILLHSLKLFPFWIGDVWPVLRAFWGHLERVWKLGLPTCALHQWSQARAHYEYQRSPWCMGLDLCWSVAVRTAYIECFQQKFEMCDVSKVVSWAKWLLASTNSYFVSGTVAGWVRHVLKLQYQRLNCCWRVYWRWWNDFANLLKKGSKTRFRCKILNIYFFGIRTTFYKSRLNLQ